MSAAAEINDQTLRAACEQEHFVAIDFGRVVQWRSEGLNPEATRISRFQIAASVVASHSKNLVAFLTIVSTLWGGLIGLVLCIAGVGVAWWILIPLCVVATFVVLFVVNFYSHAQIDRVRRPQDVLIDFSAKQITWKSLSGVHRKPLSELNGITVSTIGAPAVCDGASLSMQFKDRNLVVLETNRFCEGIDQTLHLLTPFARSLATALDVSLTLSQLETLEIGRRVALDLPRGKGLAHQLFGSREFDLRRAHRVRMKEIVSKNRHGTTYRYETWLDLKHSRSEAADEILLAKSKKVGSAGLIALRVSDYLSIPLNDRKDLAKRGAAPLDRLL